MVGVSLLNSSISTNPVAYVEKLVREYFIDELGVQEVAVSNSFLNEGLNAKR